MNAATGGTGIGTLVISFDTELIWGTFDHLAPAAFERRFPDERGTIEALLAALDRHEMAATWAVVGHLFLASCERRPDGSTHPELVHPAQSWRAGDWLDTDPATDVQRDPLWYGPDVLDAIQGARTPQEIGCHSFSHPVFDDPEMTEEAARSDLRACLDLARSRGIELRSFVYPRNREAHHGLLREAGFVAYRGRDPVWHGRLPELPARLGHVADQALGIPPPVRAPLERLPGLWSIPGSMMLLDAAGSRRFMTQRARMAKLRRGLRAAVRRGATFHVWTHPFNVAADRASLLAAFEWLLAEASRLRDSGHLRVETMGAMATRLSAQAAPPPAPPRGGSGVSGR